MKLLCTTFKPRHKGTANERERERAAEGLGFLHLQIWKARPYPGSSFKYHSGSELFDLLGGNWGRSRRVIFCSFSFWSSRSLSERFSSPGCPAAIWTPHQSFISFIYLQYVSNHILAFSSDKIQMRRWGFQANSVRGEQIQGDVLRRFVFPFFLRCPVLRRDCVSSESLRWKWKRVVQFNLSCPSHF